MFIPRKSRGGENFGGAWISQPLYAIDMDVGTVQSPAVNVTMPGAKGRDAGSAAESSR